MSSVKQKVAVSISLIKAVWLFDLIFNNNYGIKQNSFKLEEFTAVFWWTNTIIFLIILKFYIKIVQLNHHSVLV